MAQQNVLVLGASGVVGEQVADVLAGEGFGVLGVSRAGQRRPEVTKAVEMVALDLGDRGACESVASRLPPISQVINAARHDHSVMQSEDADINTQMLVNILESLEAGEHPLAHVHLVQGTKYYGSDLGPFPTPAREDDPRALASNFYFEQEDYVAAGAREGRWRWTASRPHGICSAMPGRGRSLIMVLGVYAAISRELGLPLCFPGTEANFHAVYQCTDARHLGRAIAWMCGADGPRDRAFNVTNGDFFRWANLWPVLADYFGMAAGPVRTVRLGAVMRDKASLWARIVAARELRPLAYEDAADWAYADFVFTPHWDMMSDTNRVRRAGFTEVVESREMFVSHLQRYRALRVLP